MERSPFIYLHAGFPDSEAQINRFTSARLHDRLHVRKSRLAFSANLRCQTIASCQGKDDLQAQAGGLSRLCLEAQANCGSLGSADTTAGGSSSCFSNTLFWWPRLPEFWPLCKTALKLS